MNVNLHTAMDIGHNLHVAGLDATLAEKVAWEISRAMYHKPRGRIGRNRFAFTIMKGWMLRQSMITAGSYRNFCFDEVSRFLDTPWRIT